jgi:hypothetical protein
MEHNSNTQSINDVQHENLKKLHVELDSMGSMPKSDKKPLIEDGAIISNLGWISILSLTISGLAMAGVGVGI